MIEQIPSSNMKLGEQGAIVEFLGGTGLGERLSLMGIRPGVKITRINSGFGRGPVVIKIGRAQTALGHGMSCKVIVEVER